MPNPSLIYDRTQADTNAAQSLLVAAANKQITAVQLATYLEGTRGAMVHTDANRIEAWTRYVADLLTEYGYTASVTTKTTWARGDELSLSDVTRMRRNIDALQTAFYSIPDWREITYTSSLGFEQVNTLEWDLQTINRYLEATIEAMKIRQANTLFMISGGVFNA